MKPIANASSDTASARSGGTPSWPRMITLAPSRTPKPDTVIGIVTSAEIAATTQQMSRKDTLACTAVMVDSTDTLATRWAATVMPKAASMAPGSRR